MQTHTDLQKQGEQNTLVEGRTDNSQAWLKHISFLGSIAKARPVGNE